MKVDAINKNCFMPIFTLQTENHNPRIYFTGDFFERSENSLSVENFYKKLERDLNIVSVQDVEIMAANISLKSGVDKKDVYNVMGRLSQYSSYKSLGIIEDALKEYHIDMISNLSGANNNDIFLTNVLHYIGLKNFGFRSDGLTKGKKALFIDSDLIKKVNSMPADEKEKFVKNYLQNNKIEVFYIEDFENGYNFLNQGEDFEDFTLNIIKKAKKMQNKNGKSILENLDLILNEKNYNEIDNLGLDVIVIPADNKYSPKDVADNLNSILPTEREIAEEINEVAEEPFFNKNENIKYIMKFLDTMMVSVSPRQYSIYLKDLHNEINSYLEKSGNSSKELYYLIPSENNSFIVTNYMYKKVNNIENTKNISAKFSSTSSFDTMLYNKLPDNSVIVIIDDCVMTGKSLTQEKFDYEKVLKYMPKGKDVNFIFGTLFGTKYGLNKINYIKEANNRTDDAVICTKILPEWKRQAYDTNILFPYPVAEPEVTSLVLAYMGPDTNNDSLISLYEKFMYNPEAQKVNIKYYG